MRFLSSYARLLRKGGLATLTFVVAANFHGAAHANGGRLSLVYKCGGQLPQGELQYSGKFHTEFSGDGFEYNSPVNGEKWPAQKRYSILRGTNCWIEYNVTNAPYPVYRSTGRFSEVYKSSQLFPASDDLGALLSLDRVSLISFLVTINEQAALCEDNFKPYARLGESLDQTKTKSSLREAEDYHEAVRRHSSCLTEVVNILDDQGFVGVWSDGGPNNHGFAWISGKLYSFDY